LLELPLASIASPALKQHSRDELMKFMSNVHQLIQADNHVSFKEYCLGRLLIMHVTDFLSPGESVIGNTNLQSAATETSKLIAVMAQVGSDDPVEVEQAYLAGMANALPTAKIPYQAVNSFSDVLDPVWAVLNTLKPNEKQLLLESLIITVNFDNKITCNEADLLRAVCASLHIPLPMLIAAEGDTC
jgi:hypothetical protein